MSMHPAHVPLVGELSGLQGPLIAVFVGAFSCTVVFVVVLCVLLCVRCARDDAARRRYYTFDFGADKGASIETPVNSTKALRGGPSLKSVPVGDHSPRRSCASDDAIAAPEIENYDHIGGSGVAFLDERGNPIVRETFSESARSDRDSFYHSDNSLGRDLPSDDDDLEAPPFATDRHSGQWTAYR